jgi:co-chaperonin GroES (HSP10)
MGLRPLGDRVLIKPAKSPNETASGCLLPEDRAEQYAEMQGTVIYVGTPRCAACGVGHARSVSRPVTTCCSRGVSARKSP